MNRNQEVQIKTTIKYHFPSITIANKDLNAKHGQRMSHRWYASCTDKNTTMTNCYWQLQAHSQTVSQHLCVCVLRIIWCTLTSKKSLAVSKMNESVSTAVKRFVCNGNELRNLSHIRTWQRRIPIPKAQRKHCVQGKELAQTNSCHMILSL